MNNPNQISSIGTNLGDMIFYLRASLQKGGLEDGWPSVWAEDVCSIFIVIGIAKNR